MAGNVESSCLMQHLKNCRLRVSQEIRPETANMREKWEWLYFSCQFIHFQFIFSCISFQLSGFIFNLISTIEARRRPPDTFHCLVAIAYEVSEAHIFASRSSGQPVTENALSGQFAERSAACRWTACGNGWRYLFRVRFMQIGFTALRCIGRNDPRQRPGKKSRVNPVIAIPSLTIFHGDTSCV